MPRKIDSEKMKKNPEKQRCDNFTCNLVTEIPDTDPKCKLSCYFRSFMNH